MKSLLFTVIILNQSWARLRGCSFNGVYSLDNPAKTFENLDTAKERIGEEIQKWITLARISTDSESKIYVSKYQGKSYLVEQFSIEDKTDSQKKMIEAQIKLPDALCKKSSEETPTEGNCNTSMIPKFKGCFETRNKAFLFYEDVDSDLSKNTSVAGFIGKTNKEYFNHALTLAKKFKDLAELGYLHCEINPTSILAIDSSMSDFKIFGLRSIVDPKTECNVNQSVYLPPEKVKGTFIATEPANIYSLAMTLLMFLTNELEYVKKVYLVCIGQSLDQDQCNAKHLTFIIVTLMKANLLPLADFFVRALSNEPKERHQTFTEFVEDLEKHIQLAEKEEKEKAKKNLI